jgi:hypothetical protein
MKQKLKFKKRNTLRNLLILLFGVILVVVGLIGYFWTKNMTFFYITVGANIFIIYGFVASQVSKNHVVYDIVFVKYKLENGVVRRLKPEDIADVNREESQLQIQFKNEESQQVDLSNYEDESIDEFESLLKRLQKKDRISS